MLFEGRDLAAQVVVPVIEVRDEDRELLCRRGLRFVRASGRDLAGLRQRLLDILTSRARELGVKNFIITHGLTNVPGLTMAQAKQVTEMGAVLYDLGRQPRAAHDPRAIAEI